MSTPSDPAPVPAFRFADEYARAAAPVLTASSNRELDRALRAIADEAFALRAAQRAPKGMSLEESIRRQLEALRHASSDSFGLRLLHWGADWVGERIELRKADQKHKDDVAAQVRDAEEAADHWRAINREGQQANEVLAEHGESPIFVKFDVPHARPEDIRFGANEFHRASVQVSRDYHRAKRRSLNPLPLAVLVLRLRLRIGFGRAFRLVLEPLAGMAIFIAAGWVHEVHSTRWWLTLLAIPIAVALGEMLLHKLFHHTLERRKQASLEAAIAAIGHVRSVQAINAALADAAKEMDDRLKADVADKAAARARARAAAAQGQSDPGSN